MFRAPLRNSFRELTKKFFVDTRRQKLRAQLKLREHFDNAVAAEKFESRTKWGFLEVPFRKLKFCLFFFGFSMALQAITVDEVLDEFSKRLAVPELTGTFNVQLIAKNGDTREITAKAYQKNISSKQINRLFVFDFPPTVRGTSLLLHSYFDGRKNDMWIYLPAIRRIKRIALENSGGGYFMGSDFTYRDLINNDYRKMDYKLVEDHTFDGVEYYVVKAWGKTAKIRQDNGYSYILSYYRKDNFFLMRRDYFDSNEDLLKVYQVEKVLELNPFLYPTDISMTNVQNGHKSLLRVSDVSTDAIPDRVFTTRYLRQN